MSTTLLSTISTNFSIYAGFTIFSFGIIGNLINIHLLFPTRSVPCSFLLLLGSIFNLIALCFGLLPRVLSIGFSIDASPTNLVWCKSRLFFSYIGSLSALTCICFASFERYLTSCRNVKWRNRSKIINAKISVSIATIIIVGINIPYLVFYTIVESVNNSGVITRRRVMSNSDFSVYINYVLRPILLGILPGLILILTGLGIYRNINSIHTHHIRGTFQRNLTSMILLQMITIIIPVLPFAIFNIYQTITSSISKAPNRLAIESLISNIGNIILYVSYASNFYIYLISASVYRQNLIQLIFGCRNNRIGLVTEGQLMLNTNSRTRQ